MGRGVNAPHRRTDAQDDLEGLPHVSMDYGFLGETEGEEHVSAVLVISERRHKMTWTMLVPRKGTEFPWIAKRAARFIDQRVTTSQRLKRWQGKSDKRAKKEARLFQRGPPHHHRR